MLYYVGSNFALFRCCFRAKEKIETFPPLVSNEFSDFIPNILWTLFHVFELEELQILGSTHFSPRAGVFR